MDDETGSFEAALQATGDHVDTALHAAAAVGRDLKKARVSAAGGQVRDLRKSLDAAVVAAEASLALARQAQASYTVDVSELMISGGYAKELLALAAERGVAMVEEDDRLLCYPSLIKLVPVDAALEIDRRRERRLRPSVVIDALAAAQGRPPRFNAKTFLESLAAGYDLLARAEPSPHPVVRLDQVWAVLTLLPGQAREYTRPEFARDLYLLDQSGVMATKSGRVLAWHASTGTRGAGVLTTVARSGQQQRYWGLSFG
jgi:hypothetical protein